MELLITLIPLTRCTSAPPCRSVYVRGRVFSETHKGPKILGLTLE